MIIDTAAQIIEQGIPFIVEISQNMPAGTGLLIKFRNLCESCE